MIDIDCIEEEFIELSRSLDSEGLYAWMRSVHDPHPDADEWINASESEREHLRLKAEAKHKAIVSELSRTVFTTPTHERKRQWVNKWRRENRQKARAICNRWASAHREYRREYSRSWREQMKKNQPKYQAYLAQARARKLRLKKEKDNA